MNYRHMCKLVSFLSAACCSAVSAQGMLFPEHPEGAISKMTFDKEAVQFMHLLQKNLVTSAAKPARSIIINGIVRQGHFPEKVSITAPSGCAQFDADCLQTVQHCKRSDKNPFVLNGIWILSNREVISPGVQPDPNKITIFKIPVAVLEYYPGVFKQTEILNNENFRIIKGSNSSNSKTLSASQVQEICKYGESWNDFFTENRQATKEQIQVKAESLNKTEEASNRSLRQY